VIVAPAGSSGRRKSVQNPTEAGRELDGRLEYDEAEELQISTKTAQNAVAAAVATSNSMAGSL
jgi:hypothetical protein